MQMSFRSTIRSIIGNIKKIFLQKTGMQKKHVLHDPEYVNMVKAWCMQQAILMVYTVGWHCQYIQSNYNVDSNTKSLNYMKIPLKALNYNKLWNNILN